MTLPGRDSGRVTGQGHRGIESDLDTRDRLTRYGGLSTTGGGCAPRPARSLVRAALAAYAALDSRRDVHRGTAHSFRAALFDKSAIGQLETLGIQPSAQYS